MKENEFYPKLISNTEKRYVDYKQMLSDTYKEKYLYDEWYISFLKYMKKIEEKTLKNLVREWTELKYNNGW